MAYAAAACLVCAATACSSVDVTKALALTDVKTGWYDAGVLEDGKNKLVPSISFKLTVQGDQPISTVQVNAIFRRANEPEAWGEHFIKAIGTTPLAPGQSTGFIVARSYLGYTGEQPRQVMLKPPVGKSRGAGFTDCYARRRVFPVVVSCHTAVRYAGRVPPARFP